MNGFDERGYRLGYGGGFFDRTLAACERRMVAIGVSYEMLRVPTIHPQPYDIPMDFVVTESAIYAAGGEPLQAVDAAASRKTFRAPARCAAVCRGRRLTGRGIQLAGVLRGDQFPEYFGDKNSDEVQE